MVGAPSKRDHDRATKALLETLDAELEAWKTLDYARRNFRVAVINKLHRGEASQGGCPAQDGVLPIPVRDGQPNEGSWSQRSRNDAD